MAVPQLIGEKHIAGVALLRLLLPDSKHEITLRQSKPGKDFITIVIYLQRTHGSKQNSSFMVDVKHTASVVFERHDIALPKSLQFDTHQQLR